MTSARAERDALHLAHVEARGRAIEQTAELEALDDPGQPALALRPRHPLGLEPEGQVGADREPREQGIVLEDEADAARLRRQAAEVAAVDPDGPGVRREEARDHGERRRLAAAGGPQERDELPGCERELETVDRGDRAEALAQLLKRKARRRAHRFTAPKVSPRTRWRWIT